MLATKTVKVQKVSVVVLSERFHNKFIGRGDFWHLKLSAALIFRTLKDFAHAGDSVVIDKDFQGKNEDMVHHYLKRLFGHEYLGDYPMDDPNISFATARNNTFVRHADMKTKLARHGRYPRAVSAYDITKAVDPYDITRYFSLLN
jgi:hypothetical protein